MNKQERRRGASARQLAAIGALFAAYLFVLQRFWFDAPVSDDYDIALAEVMHMADVHSLREWLAIVVAQHNEHRVAVVRVVAWALATLFGTIDFRVLAFLGNLSVLGLCLVAWGEFRGAVSGAFLGAAALLVCQLSYWEASLMATAALPNLGVVFFSSASLFFAMRPGRAAVAWSVAFALLAAGSQANGLFALPLAAAASALVRRPRRAWLFATVAVLLWALYFWHYERPAHHPSPLTALAQPLAAAQFFLMVIGGVVPGRWPPVAAGATVMAVLAWLAWRGTWRAHPAAALCVAFVLASAVAVAAGRVGLGVLHSSRYAIYSTWIVAIAFLAVCAELRPSGRRLAGLSLAGAAAFALAVSWSARRNAQDFSLAGNMLFKVVPASAEVTGDPYTWTLHPNPPASRAILMEAERRGLYSPPRRLVHAPEMRAIDAVPEGARVAGVIDEVNVSGVRVSLSGWSDIPATTPGRILAVNPGEPAPALARYEVVGRPDVVMTLRDERLAASGFRADLDYPSADVASRVAASLCVVIEGPDRRPARLHWAKARCPNGRT